MKRKYLLWGEDDKEGHFGFLVGLEDKANGAGHLGAGLT